MHLSHGRACQGGVFCGRLGEVGNARKWMFILLPLTVVAAGVFLWLHIDNQVRRLLHPVNSLYSGYSELPKHVQGLNLEPFTVVGDGNHVIRACLATVDKSASASSPRQQLVHDRMGNSDLSGLMSVDYVLVSADWDHGVRSALPMAERLSAAGLRCVLWEPSGKDEMRSYCTHGIRESKDITYLIDELERRTGQRELVILGIGRDFGAELMLHAAANEPRLRGVVAIDVHAPLNKVLQRRNIPIWQRELVSWRMKELTGLEPFDFAAVKSVFTLPREKPVLFICSGQKTAETMPEDTYALYTQLHQEQRRLYVPRRPEDPADSTCRMIRYTQPGGTHSAHHDVRANILDDADAVLPAVLQWINEIAPGMRESPAPTRQGIEASESPASSVAVDKDADKNPFSPSS